MPAPANDLCVAATVISSLPFAATLDTTLATASVDDPIPSNWGDVLSHTVWYAFTPGATGRYIFTSSGSDYFANVSIHTGSCGALTEVASGTWTAFGVTLTSGTPYLICIGDEDSSGGSLVLTVRVAAPVGPPVLSQGILESTAVQLVWTLTASQWRIERCSGAGCTSFVQDGILAISPAGRGGLTAGATYRFRVCSADDLEGDGPYSNILDVTTPAGSVGLSQYGGMVRMISGFSRPDANLHPGLIHISGPASYGGPILELHATQEPAGVGLDCAARRSAVYLKYREGGSAQITSAQSAKVLETQHAVGTDLINCADTQILELRFRLGSADSLTATHTNDGYIEVRLNGVVILSVTGLRLGWTGTANWGSVRLGPSGGVDDAGANGGLTSLEVSQIDSYTDLGSMLYSRTSFVGATDAEVWASAGGYWSRLGLAGQAVPPYGTGLFLQGDKIICGIGSGGWGGETMYRQGLSPATLTPGPPTEEDEDDEGSEPGGGDDEDVPSVAEAAGVFLTQKIRRLRQAPHLSRASTWQYYDAFELDLDAGLGLVQGQGRDPQVILQWSDDGGHTWSNEHWTSAGLLGAYRQRALWQRLGRSRDRVFRIVLSDPVPWQIADALLQIRGGTS